MGGVRTGLDAFEFVLAGASRGAGRHRDLPRPVGAGRGCSRELAAGAGRARGFHGSPTPSATPTDEDGDRVTDRSAHRGRPRHRRPRDRRRAGRRRPGRTCSTVKVGLELFLRHGARRRAQVREAAAAARCSSTSSCTTSPTRSPVRRDRSPSSSRTYLTVHACRRRRHDPRRGRRTAGHAGRRRHHSHLPVAREHSPPSASSARRATPSVGSRCSRSTAARARWSALRSRSPRRAEVGADIVLITPGVRLSGARRRRPGRGVRDAASRRSPTAPTCSSSAVPSAQRPSPAAAARHRRDRCADVLADRPSVRHAADRALLARPRSR